MLPELKKPNRTLGLSLSVAAMLALGLFVVPRMASDSTPEAERAADCSPRQGIAISKDSDAVELAAAVFPCADTAIVVNASSGDAEVKSGVAAAIKQKIPFLVRTDSNSAQVDSTLKQLDAEAVDLPADTPNSDMGAIASLLGGADNGDTHVLPAEPSTEQLALVPSLHATGLNVVFAKPGDAEALTNLARTDTSYTFSDDFDETDRWRASIDSELPGGGYTLFPDRRIIAFYGHPTTSALGLLGEQGAEATVERLKAKTPQYETGDIPTIGGFEIITTVATAEATPEGNYTRGTDAETLRPWIDVATENDLYVILDLQPGRVDFLTQAKEYEEFLKLPNVGLALDPEWRLEPDQVHLRQIGSVEAAEVNTVVDYLAELVREHNLPQKALVLHQFQTRMLANRADIRTPPELAVTVHVDGQGPLGTKYGTWDSMLADPIGADQDLWWGWKNFIDEDIPTATPEQVNKVEPLPSVVTYQ